MANEEYGIAYKEILEILKYIPKEEYNKIPKEKIEVFQTNADKNYSFEFNPDKTLDEQNISKTAKTIIGILYRDYWATPYERETIIAVQNKDRARREEEKRAKYNPNDIFKDTKQENFIEEKVEANLPVEAEKERFFKNLINYIKEFILNKFSKNK